VCSQRSTPLDLAEEASVRMIAPPPRFQAGAGLNRSIRVVHSFRYCDALVAQRKLARPLPCALLTHDIDIASPSAGSLNNAPSPPMDFSIGTVIHEYVLAA
jgi:hypothetical protein